MAAALSSGLRRLRGLFGGSGGDCLCEPEICDIIVKLSGKAKPNVMYLGTATYDALPNMQRQTSCFSDMGCVVKPLDVAHQSPSLKTIEQAFDEADVVVVSGGNTLFAVGRWNRLGVSDQLRRHADRLVLTGGSAGAICWFDGGHSDSGDPTTFRHPTVDSQDAVAAQWEYVRVDGIGLLPGLCCPHHDKVQSNGVLRAVDLDQMLLRHPNERAICIDHFAALVVDGDSYRVFQMTGKQGSVSADGTFLPDRSGLPGVWVKEVDSASGSQPAHVRSWLAPSEGRLADLVRAASSPIIADLRIEQIRTKNSADF